MTTSTHLRQVAARTALDGIAEALTEGASTIEILEATIARRDAVIKLLEGEVADAHERNAALVAVLARDRAFIHLDRQSLADSSMRPDNTMETDDAKAVAEYDALLADIDSSMSGKPGRPPLAPEHKGFHIDYSGLLGGARRQTHGSTTELLRQLEVHLEELGERFYSGDMAAVDEFLQLYCVAEDDRRTLVGGSR